LEFFDPIGTFVYVFDFFIEKLHKANKIKHVEQTEIWGYLLIGNGFTFHIRNNNIIVKYAYPIDEIPKPGAFPSFEMPELRAYTEIMNESCEYIEEILLSFNSVDNLKYNRIGVVADANLEGDSLPPGINVLIDYIGKPWNNQIISVNSKFLSKLDEQERYCDQCCHLIEFSGETISKTGYRINLDWQRIFKEPKTLNKKTFEEVLNCKEKAFQYFESFGAGDLNYD